MGTGKGIGKSLRTCLSKLTFSKLAITFSPINVHAPIFVEVGWNLGGNNYACRCDVFVSNGQLSFLPHKVLGISLAIQEITSECGLRCWCTSVGVDSDKGASKKSDCKTDLSIPI